MAFYKEKNKKIMIVTAHADDETLGMGGTISKLSGLGYEIMLLAVAINANKQLIKELGFSSIASYRSSKIKSLKAAVKILGISSYKVFDYNATELPKLFPNEIIKKIKCEIDAFKPSSIYTHFREDINQDHRVLNMAVMTAARPKVNFFIQNIFTFEIPNSTGWNGSYEHTNFHPNYFEVIEEKHLKKKIEAFKCYVSELESPPSLHSEDGIVTCAKFRGMSVGYEYGESFEMLRCISI